MKRSSYVIFIVCLILLIDQLVKIWVKTHMYYAEFIPIFGLKWAYIHFVENKGMAFGWELGGSYGKLALSLFRLLAVGLMIYFIRRLIKEKVSFGVLFGFSLILAGAIGNIIDSAVYGMIFSESYPNAVAEFMPEEGGYGTFLHGRVVDMLYFPIYDNVLPEWIPIWGGERFTFFRPVFNIADSAITIGVLYMLLFQRKFFTQNSAASKETPPLDQQPDKQVPSISSQDQERQLPPT